jgi:hypothetical protein
MVVYAGVIVDETFIVRFALMRFDKDDIIEDTKSIIDTANYGGKLL